MSKNVQPKFSFMRFMVSGFTFRSLIHFEFIFLCGGRKCSNLILLHVAVKFSQNNLLKRLLSITYSSLHCCRLIDHSVGVYFWALFCYINLSVCFCSKYYPTGHSTQKQQNTYSFQVYLQHSAGQIQEIMLGHKTSLKKFKTTEIISNIFSQLQWYETRNNYRQKNGKSINTWRLNNMLLRKQVNEEIKLEIRKHLKTNELGKIYDM